jgi:hypothetical protein
LAGEFIGAPPQEHCVDRLVDLREVHRGVVDDPIDLAAGPGDVPVNARGNSVKDLAHLTSRLGNGRCLTTCASAASDSLVLPYPTFHRPAPEFHLGLSWARTRLSAACAG